MTQVKTTSLANLRKSSDLSAPAEMKAGFDTVGGFDLIQRAAKLFATSSIVPPQYQSSSSGDANFANCVIAIDMAMRMGANPLMVMQNLYLVYNRPAWSAKFLIATVNKCGRFSALSYEFQGKEGTDEWGCRAVAMELATGEKLAGPLITIGLAKKEGWYDKKSKDSSKPASKWPTMPELMLRYRAASWFVSVYAPELAMGLQTVEEVQDTYDMELSSNGVYQVSTDEIRRNGPDDEKPEAAPAAGPSEPETPSPEPAPKKKGKSKSAAAAATVEPTDGPTESEPEPEPEENTLEEGPAPEIVHAGMTLEELQADVWDKLKEFDAIRTLEEYIFKHIDQWDLDDFIKAHEYIEEEYIGVDAV